MADEPKPKSIHAVQIARPDPHHKGEYLRVEDYDTPPMVATEAEVQRWVQAQHPGKRVTVTARPARMATEASAAPHDGAA